MVGPAGGGADVVDHLINGVGNGVIDDHASLLHLGDHLVGNFGRPVLADLRGQLLLELSPGLGLGEPGILEFLAVQVADDKPDESENEQEFE